MSTQVLSLTRYEEFFAWLRLCGMVYRAKGAKPCAIEPWEIREARDVAEEQRLLGSHGDVTVLANVSGSMPKRRM